MVLYTNMSLDLMGVSDIQMETMVSAAISTVNVGFENSNIGIDTTTVYKGRVSCAMSVSNRRASSRPYVFSCDDEMRFRVSNETAEA